MFDSRFTRADNGRFHVPMNREDCDALDNFLSALCVWREQAKSFNKSASCNEHNTELENIISDCDELYTMLVEFYNDYITINA